MKLRILLPILCLLLMSVSIRAQQRSQANVIGIGAVPCQVFTFQYKKEPQRVEQEYEMWVHGFMSGHNWVVLDARLEGTNYPMGHVRDLLGATAKEQMDGIREYCERNPSQPFPRAVLEILSRLSTMK
jgi:hypothetical protein